MERRSDSSLLTQQSGFSLVEMLVAILMTAIIVMGTFSGLLLTKADLGGSDNEMLISQSQKSLLDTLKSYQAACVQNSGTCTAADASSGPNQSGAANTWSLPQDGVTGTGVSSGCSALSFPTSCTSVGPACANGSSYALAVNCYHDVSSMLPTAIQNSPYCGTMCYTVTNRTSGTYDQSTFVPQVQVSVQWTKKSS